MALFTFNFFSRLHTDLHINILTDVLTLKMNHLLMHVVENCKRTHLRSTDLKKNVKCSSMKKINL